MAKKRTAGGAKFWLQIGQPQGQKNQGHRKNQDEEIALLPEIVKGKSAMGAGRPQQEFRQNIAQSLTSIALQRRLGPQKKESGHQHSSQNGNSRCGHFPPFRVAGCFDHQEYESGQAEERRHVENQGQPQEKGRPPQ